MKDDILLIQMKDKRIAELEAKLIQSPRDARCQLFKQTQQYQVKADVCNKRIADLERQLAECKEQVRRAARVA